MEIKNNMVAIPETAVGLIKGRHNLPVSKYIFETNIENPMDFLFMDEVVDRFIRENYNIHTEIGFGLNSISEYCSEVYVGDHIDLVVTGLTAATAAVIKAAAINGCGLTLWHYNVTSGSYEPQRIF